MHLKIVWGIMAHWQTVTKSEKSPEPAPAGFGDRDRLAAGGQRRSRRRRMAPTPTTRTIPSTTSSAGGPAATTVTGLPSTIQARGGYRPGAIGAGPQAGHYADADGQTCDQGLESEVEGRPRPSG